MSILIAQNVILQLLVWNVPQEGCLRGQIVLHRAQQDISIILGLAAVIVFMG